MKISEFFEYNNQQVLEENENILDWALNNFNINQEKIDIEIKQAIPAFNENLNENVNKALRILPSKEMEGFFVAKFKKNEI